MRSIAREGCSDAVADVVSGQPVGCRPGEYLPSALVSTKRPFHTRRAAESGPPEPLCPMRAANAEQFLIAVSYLMTNASRTILAASVVRTSELQSRLSRDRHTYGVNLTFGVLTSSQLEGLPCGR